MAARPQASPTLIAYLQELVEEALAELPRVTRRKLLASDGWFVEGRLFALVNRQGRVVLRLPAAVDQDALLAVPGTEPWQIGKRRPMRGWLMLPEAMPDDGPALRRWLGRAYGVMRQAGDAAPAKRSKARARMTSPAQALALLRRVGMATASANVEGIPCLAEEVAGGRIAGSWWAHPRGKAIYALLEALEDGAEVVSLKLLEGKATYLHRALWPALLAVVLDPGWRRARVRALDAEARALLRRVEQAPRRGEAPAAARALEAAALVHCSSEHTEQGRHQKRLTSWAHWASAHRARAEGTLEEGLKRLEAAAAGHPTALRSRMQAVPGRRRRSPPVAPAAPRRTRHEGPGRRRTPRG